jgi:hypothetical protein
MSNAPAVPASNQLIAATAIINPVFLFCTIPVLRLLW